MATCATPKMKFALFCATKINNKELDLSFEECSNLINMTKNGQTDKVIEYLKNKGGVCKGEVKPKVDWQSIYDKAHAAGMVAARNCRPTPMIVEERSNPLDDTSEVKNAWLVDSGVCGFSSVRFPANTSFAKWAIKNKLADKSYDTGAYIWAGRQMEEFSGTQSYEIKNAYTTAFAKVLREAGIKKVYVESRLD